MNEAEFNMLFENPDTSLESSFTVDTSKHTEKTVKRVREVFKIKIRHEGAFGFPAAVIEYYAKLDDGLYYTWYRMQEQAEAAQEEFPRPSQMAKAI